MAYSTGSGDYVALMAAVLSHAISDGWTEANGVGSGWPIISPSGRIRGVDWSTYTAAEFDYTLGGSGTSKTQRWIRIGVGVSPANATANAQNSAAVVPNMAYNFSEWHIFSDLTVNEHIHVVVKFSNGVNSDVYGHFSFGEIDKGGLTYHSIAYATAADRRGYAQSTSGGSTTSDYFSGGNWNTLNRCGNAFSGQAANSDNGWSALCYIVHGLNAPIPNGTGGWPAWDTFINNGSYVWAAASRVDSTLPSFSSDRDGHFGTIAWWPPVNPQTGYVNLAPIPFAMINGTSLTTRMRWLGVFPNVRFVGMNGINPGEEVTFGGETWKCFPLSRATDWSELNVTRRITSGYAGYAYKKVV